MSNQTGPTSVAGKLISSMNRLKHSGCADTLFIAGENPDDFFALLENAFEQYQPAFDQDAILVTRSVRANWILMRRDRAAEAVEANLYSRKPGATHFNPEDLHEAQLFDRYRTTAQRIFTRTLLDLQLIQKIARAGERWRHQLAKEKQKLAQDVERFELLKQRAAAKTPEQQRAEVIASATTEKQDVQVDEHGPYIAQAVYVAADVDGVTEVFDIVPSNNEVRRLIAMAGQLPTPPVEVVRTYIFAGRIPPEYEWLIAEDWEREAEHQELRKTLSFTEWATLTAKEEK
jgi:hypothetical protein